MTEIKIAIGKGPVDGYTSIGILGGQLKEDARQPHKSNFDQAQR